MSSRSGRTHDTPSFALPGRSRGRARAAPVRFGRHHLDLCWYTLLVCSVASVTLRELRASHMYLLAPALVLLAGLILIVRLQTLSPPVRVEPYALWHRTQELLEQPVPACVSAEAGRPWIALGAPLGLFLGFVAAFVNATDRARDRCLGSRLCRIWHVRPHLDPPSLIWAEKQVFTSVSGTRE
jgi:hypothetical protein